MNGGRKKNSQGGNFTSPAGCPKQSCCEIHPEAATGAAEAAETETKRPAATAKIGATTQAAVATAGKTEAATIQAATDGRQEAGDSAKTATQAGGGRPTIIGFIYRGRGNASTSFLIAVKGEG